MIGFVYKLTMDKCGAFYIGSTQDPKARYYAHKSELKRGIHGSHMFQKAWDDSGSAELTMEVLFSGSKEDAQATELALLKSNASSPDLKNTCVNSLKGIEYSRLSDPDSVRRRISERTRGERNPMFGKTHTAEVRAIISKRFKGKPNPSAAHPLTEETKRKIAETKRLNPMIGEKNPFYGKKHTPESLSKMRESQFKRYTKLLETDWTHVQARRILIDGVEYRSQSVAAKALGVSIALITYRLKHPNRYPNYQSLAADQQVTTVDE